MTSAPGDAPWRPGPTLRIVSKLCAVVILVVVLLVFPEAEVSFVYTGF